MVFVEKIEPKGDNTLEQEGLFRKQPGPVRRFRPRQGSVRNPVANAHEAVNRNEGFRMCSNFFSFMRFCHGR
jgi:hypothetical protein